MSLLNAVSTLRNLSDLDRKRAENLFTLAILNARYGYPEVARGYARECVVLLRRIGTDSLEDCATSATCVENVTLPDFLHEDVVRERLRALGVEL